jgi:hypothetical protein
VLGDEMSADRIVAIADRGHREHQPVRDDVDVTGEPDGYGELACGLRITRDFGNHRAVSNEGGRKCENRRHRLERVRWRTGGRHRTMQGRRCAR